MGRMGRALRVIGLSSLSSAFLLAACGEAPQPFELRSQGTARLGLVSCGPADGGSGGSGGAWDAAPGALIVDLGISPQTNGNALKPYGLVYELVKSKQIPVLWAYRTNKVANTDVDFTVDGRSFRGGAFVIPGAYVATAQATVNA